MSEEHDFSGVMMNALGKYASYQDLGRLEYGRLLGAKPCARARDPARLRQHLKSPQRPVARPLISDIWLPRQPIYVRHGGLRFAPFTAIRPLTSSLRP